MKRHHATAVVLLVASVIAASCGDDDEATPTTSGGPAATSPSTEPGATAGPTDSPSETTSPSETISPSETSSPSEPTNEAELVIGNILSRSGSLTIALPADVGLNIAVDEINDAGGLVVGDTAYQLVIEEKDDRTDAAASAAAARELLQAGVPIIFGPNGPGAASVLELTRGEKVIMVSASSGAAAQLSNPDPQYLLTALPSATDRGLSATAALSEAAPEAKTLMLIGPDDATMGAVVDSLSASWTANGGTVSSVLYPPDTSDLSIFLAKVSDEDPDALYVGYNGPTVSLVLQQLDAAGVASDMVIMGHGTSATAAAEAGGRPYIAVELSPGPLTGEGASAESVALVDKYFAETGESELPAFPPSIRYYYDIMHSLADAMVAAGTVEDTDAILAELLGTEYRRVGALGDIGFSTEGFIQHPLNSTFVQPDGTTTSLNWEPTQG